MVDYQLFILFVRNITPKYLIRPINERRPKVLFLLAQFHCSNDGLRPSARFFHLGRAESHNFIVREQKIPKEFLTGFKKNFCCFLCRNAQNYEKV